MKAQFSLDGPRMHLPASISTPTARRPSASGDVDFSHWPEQSYHVKSRVHFPRMRELFFTNETWRLDRRRRFQRHVPAVQGRPRSERHVHQRAGRRQRNTASRRCMDRCSGRRTAFDVWNAGAGVLRRRRAVRVFDQAARHADVRRRSDSTRPSPTRTSRRSPTSGAAPGLRFAGAADRRTSAGMAARDNSPSAAAAGNVVGHAAGRRRR